MSCHPDCGPITTWDALSESHAHTNEDGRCWHGNSDTELDEVDAELAAERRDVIRSLHTAYVALGRVEFWTTDVARILDSVQAKILEICPDAAEYDAIVHNMTFLSWADQVYETRCYVSNEMPHNRQGNHA